MADTPEVLLIGGAPGVGKTTLGRALAAKIGAASLTVDDLLTAAKGVTTALSHPGLHVMSRVPFVEYFTASSVEQLKVDATAQHEATWPAIESVVRSHALWGPSIVIDGWALRPDKVTALALDHVRSFWLVAEPNVLRERERQNVGFVRDSADPERMLQNFLGRSLWYNDWIEQQALALGLCILRQDGHVSVDELCQRALRAYEL